jgi:hypothetical protein
VNAKRQNYDYLPKHLTVEDVLRRGAKSKAGELIEVEAEE